MQQSSPATAPAPAPAAPLPPAPAQAPSVAVQGPGGPELLEHLPRNAAEVEGLRERREILRDQLERATNRRAGLVNELRQADARGLAVEARAGIQQRLNLLDERILQLERDQAYTERLLSNAPPAVLAELRAVEPVYRPGSVDEDEAVAMMFGGFGAGLVLALVVGRLRRRFSRRGGRAAASAAAVPALAEDPRIERLTQAVDAIAEEVERIGEGQRFVTNLLASRREGAMLGVEAERR